MRTILSSSIVTCSLIAIKRKLFFLVILCCFFNVFAHSQITISVEGQKTEGMGFMLQGVSTTNTSGGSAGRADETIVITTKMSAINFHQFFLSGKVLSSVNIDVSNAGSPTPYHIGLKDATIFAYKEFTGTVNSLVSPGNGMYEEVSLRYKKIETVGTPSAGNSGSSENNNTGMSGKENATDNIENGYQTIVCKFDILNNEHVNVKINGKNVLSFGDGSKEVDLSHFLVAGKMNNITFTFDKGAYSKINLMGKFAGDEKGIPIYSFQPSSKALEGTFDFAFSGKKK
jgi:hypothetical protein